MKGRLLTAAEIAEFTEHLVLEERSAATVEKYVRDVRAFAAYAPDGEITKETVIAYKKHLQEIYAVRSVNSIVIWICKRSIIYPVIFYWNVLNLSLLQKLLIC